MANGHSGQEWTFSFVHKKVTDFCRFLGVLDMTLDITGAKASYGQTWTMAYRPCPFVHCDARVI